MRKATILESSKMREDIHETVAGRLRREGYRYTRNLRTLVEILSEAQNPLAIPELLVARTGLALSSVYRNLAILERADVVYRILTNEGAARYELDEGLTEHHHHLICTSCGMVEDFVASTRLERSVTSASAEIAAGAGFSTHTHRLDLMGLCRNCT